jgi:hypothetical protein
MKKIFLHIGKHKSIYLEDLIGIFDIKNLNLSEIKFPEKIVNNSSGKSDSVIITDKVIYISPISPYVLFKRKDEEDFKNERGKIL